MAKEASSFQGKVVIISGGAQGIGEATARLFAERDAAGWRRDGHGVNEFVFLLSQLPSIVVKSELHPIWWTQKLSNKMGWSVRGRR